MVRYRDEQQNIEESSYKALTMEYKVVDLTERPLNSS